MNLLFTPDEEEVNEDGEIIQAKEKHFKPVYHEQYFLFSVYNNKLNQSLGDVNAFSKG